MTGKAVRRGEVWLADLGDPIGHEQGYRRPVVIISVNELHAVSRDLAIVVPTTTRDRGWPTHIRLPAGPAELDRHSFAKVEDIRSISFRRLSHRLGTVETTVLDQIGVVLRSLLDL